MISTLPRRRRRPPSGFIARAVAGLGAAPAFAQTSLSLESAVAEAAVRSRLVSAIESQAQAAREMAVAAGQLPDPVLKLGLNNLPIDGPDRYSVTRDFMTMRSVGVMQEFTRDDKRKARAARFEREAERGRGSAAPWRLRICGATPRWPGWTATTRSACASCCRRSAPRRAAGRGGGCCVPRRARFAGDVFAARRRSALIDDRIRQTERQVATATHQARALGRAERAAAARAATRPGHDAACRPAAWKATSTHHPQIAADGQPGGRGPGEADVARSNKRPTGASS